ncbi:MAG: KUP/HAK/KT family potassium transporter, partial [Patescibacteria group bacterium]
MKKLFFLSLAALGIVYGDIGTSPLYAINEIFFGHAREAITRTDVLGIISIVFWALTLTISVEYILLVLRADSD